MEIVDFPIEMAIFHSFRYYQRVNPIKSHETPSFSDCFPMICPLFRWFSIAANFFGLRKPIGMLRLARPVQAAGDDGDFWSMAMTQEPIDWRYLPYTRPRVCKGICQQNIA